MAFTHSVGCLRGVENCLYGERAPSSSSSRYLIIITTVIPITIMCIMRHDATWQKGARDECGGELQQLCIGRRAGLWLLAVTTCCDWCWCWLGCFSGGRCRRWLRRRIHCH